MSAPRAASRAHNVSELLTLWLAMAAEDVDDEERRPWLAGVCRVSKMWHPIARKLLFRRIRVQNPSLENGNSAWLQRYLKRDEARYLVIHLEMATYVGETPGGEHIDNSEYIAFLEQLPNLRSLHVIDHGWHISEETWAEALPVLPSITELCIAHGNEALLRTFFERFPCLQSLSIPTFHMDQGDEDRWAQLSLPRLVRLDIWQGDGLHADQYHFLRALFKAAHATLTDICLVSFDGDVLDRAFEGLPFPNLQWLTVKELLDEGQPCRMAWPVPSEMLSLGFFWDRGSRIRWPIELFKGLCRMAATRKLSAFYFADVDERGPNDLLFDKLVEPMLERFGVDVIEREVYEVRERSASSTISDDSSD